MSYEDFEKYINSVKAVRDYSTDLLKCYDKHKADGYIIQPDCTTSTIDLLGYIFNDTDNIINKFCNKYNFGKGYKGKEVERNSDGSIIDLSNIQGLYNYLINR